MRKLSFISTLPGDGLRPELQKLFDRLAFDPYADLFIRHDGMMQSGPDPSGDHARSVEPQRIKSA